MDKDEALTLEALKYAASKGYGRIVREIKIAPFTIKGDEALAQPAQEPVAYDKTEMNGFVQDLYDKKMQEGKHGHYETMFHVVHQAIKRATPPQRPWVWLTDEERVSFDATNPKTQKEWDELFDGIEDKPKEKNNG